MKKIFTVFVIIAMLVVLAVSCGSTKICPAYSSNSVEQADVDNC